MKTKLLNPLIFLLVTPLTISTTILLLLTFLTTATFSDKDINPKEDFITKMSAEQFLEQQGINLIESDLEIFKIKDSEILTEELKNPIIQNIKEQK